MPLLSAFYRWRSRDEERSGDSPKSPQLGSGKSRTKSWSVPASKAPDLLIISSFQQATQNSTCGIQHVHESDFRHHHVPDVCSYPNRNFLVTRLKNNRDNSYCKSRSIPIPPIFAVLSTQSLMLTIQTVLQTQCVPALRPTWVLWLRGSGFPGPLLGLCISIFKKPSKLAPSFIEFVWIPGFKFLL